MGLENCTPAAGNTAASCPSLSWDPEGNRLEILVTHIPEFLKEREAGDDTICARNGLGEDDDLNPI